MDLLNLTHPAPIQTISPAFCTTLDVLRLDLIDPVVSGNKWYKLKYNVLKVLEQSTKHPELPCALLTFGGPYSNHIHATAAAGMHFKIPTIGIIRGEDHPQTSPTLKDAADWGMQLEFISRSAYAEKDTEDFKSWIYEQYGHVHIVPEGGSNYLGLNGCMDILTGIDVQGYDAIVCAMGTGTTVAGLLLSTPATLPIYGVPVLKNGGFLKDEVRKHLFYFLVDQDAVTDIMDRLVILDQYHYGGYGKWTPELIQKMAEIEKEFQLPLDRVYTAKAFEALSDDALRDKKTLFIHTGGLQGNR